MTADLPPTPVFELQRLILRPLRLEDAPALKRRFAHWDVVRYLPASAPWPYPGDHALTHVQKSLEKTERGEESSWAITLKDGDDELVGQIGLHPNAGAAGMRGFWLGHDYWGRGLMSEAADAITAYAFETLDWPHIIATNAAGNVASQRIKQRQGFVLIEVGESAFVEGVQPVETWRLTREAWRRERKPTLEDFPGRS